MEVGNLECVSLRLNGLRTMFETSQQLNSSPDPRPAGEARVRYHFAIRAAADPAALSRVIELFSILSLVPDTVQARRVGADELRIDVVAQGITQLKSQHLQLRIGQFPMVQSVLVEKDAEPAAELDYREAVFQMRRAVRPAG